MMDVIHNGILITSVLRFSSDKEINEFIDDVKIDEYGTNLVEVERQISEQFPNQEPDK